MWMRGRPRRRGELGSAALYVGIVLIVIGAYLVLTFVPPWYKSWKAKNMIGEVVAGYTLEGLNEYQLKESIVNKLNSIGVDVTEPDVSIDLNSETKTIKVEVNWKALVKFPFTRKTTTLNFFLKVKRKAG